MKDAYSFLRWSTKGQNAENRDSKARQTESAEKWITEYGKGEYQLSKEVFIADGQSAFKGKHIEKDEYGKAKGELARFIELVKDGTIKQDSILLVDTFDRFSRLPVLQSFGLFNDVLLTGVGLVFTGSFDKRILTEAEINKEPHILFAILGEMIRSNSESAEKSKKILNAQKNKLVKMQNGEVLKHHCAPKYYSYNPANKSYEQNKLTPTVKRIIEEYLNGRSLYFISNDLNAENIRSLRYSNVQANWSRMAIKSLLESKCLYGEFLGIQNYFGEPVIDKPTWDKIQMMLNRSTLNKGRYSAEYINIFRGLAWCEHCNRAMSIGVQKTDYKRNKPRPKAYRFLRCSSRGNSLPCIHHAQLNLNKVEESFFTDFLAKNPADIINGDDKKEAKIIADAITEKQTQLNKISEKATALGALAGVIATADLLKQGQALKSQQGTLQREIDELNTRRASIMAAPVSRDLIATVIEFDAENGKDKETPQYLPYSYAEIEKNLQDNALRLQLRTNLPNLISKIVFNTTEKTYCVFNRSGKEVFKSSRLDDEQISGKVMKYISSKTERAKTLKMTGKGELQKYLESLKSKFRAEIAEQQRQRGIRKKPVMKRVKD